MRRTLRRSVTGALAGAVLLAAAPPEAPVAEAARRGDRDAVVALVRQGADVNAALADGMTALHWAAANGDADIAEVLIYAGANLEAVTRLGQHTALHVAARSGRPAVVRLLAASGANPNARSSTGVTPLHLAAQTGIVEGVRALLEKGAEIDARESSWDQTALIFAASWNHVDVIELLLEHGADVSVHTRAVNLAERAALDEAAMEVRDGVYAAFREQKGNDPAWRPTAAEVQAAVRAAQQVQLGVVKPPSEGGGGEGSGGDEGFAPASGVQGGLTPLLHAVREGHVEATMALLDGGADIDQPKLGDNTTPILMAAINGHYDLLLKLLERGADPNIASSDGAAPLFAVLSIYWAPKTRYPQPQYHQFQKATYLETMEALLKAGANVNARLEQDPWYLMYTFGSLGVEMRGATPFWRAAHATDVEAMRLLVQYGADPHLPTLTPATAGGGRGRRGGGGGDGPDPSGLPPVPLNGPAVYPIHAAAGVGYGNGFTANFHRHAPDAWMASVKYLVEELGADVHVRDLNGYNVIHHAASRGDNEMVTYFVEKGVDVMAVSRRGQTTVDMANGPGQRISPFPSTIALLEGLGAKNNHNCVSC